MNWTQLELFDTIELTTNKKEQDVRENCNSSR
jgi:hypothetical protein